MIPFEADYINGSTFEQLQPSQIHVANTWLFQYFKRYLLQKAVSVFKWELPDYWHKTLFLYCLYCEGRVAIVKTREFGVLPQPCTLGGRGVQYEPTYAIIANPLLRGIVRPRIDTQCAVVHIMPDYGGIVDIVNYYAREMAATVETMEINILNSKLSYVFGVDKSAGSGNRKTVAEGLKKLYDEIMSGSPAVFADINLIDRNGNETWKLFLQDVGKNFIAPDLQELLRKYECEFCAKVGIPSNLATTKKERVNTFEVNANNTETATGPDLWLEYAREGLSKANELFGLNLSVDWRYKPDVGYDTIGNGDVQ